MSRAGDRRVSRGPRLVAAVVLLAALASPAPALSESSQGHLRPGNWMGEFSTFAELTGTTQGTDAVYDGHISGLVFLEVSEDGTVAEGGDWWFDGRATIELTGSLTGTITHVYDARGTVSGNSRALTLSGTNTTSGSVFVQGQAGRQPGVVSEVTIPDIVLTPSGCNEVDAAITPPLELLAQEAEWTGRDISGLMFLVYADETIDDDLIEARIVELGHDVDAWGHAMLASGEVDVTTAHGLIIRARSLGADMAQSDCLFSDPRAKEWFTVLLGMKMTSYFATALAQHPDMAGIDLAQIAILQPALGASPVADDQVYPRILRAADAILGRGLAPGTGEAGTCDPCLVDGASTTDVAHAALALTLLGETSVHLAGGREYVIGEIYDVFTDQDTP